MRGPTLTLLALTLAALACGSDSPSSPDTATVPVEVGAWLRQNATEFRTSIAVGSDEDLAVLTSLVGNARVVALGEATHGTSDFFEMKHRLLRYLVEHMGFNAFAIEATFPEAEAIDEYVRTGKGDPAILLSRLYFWTWNTQEVADMIQWMRAYNQTVPAEKQVRFFGFDMQSPGAATDSLRAYVARTDPGRGADSVNAALGCYLPYMNDYRGVTRLSYSSASPELKALCKAGVAAAYAWVAAHQPQYEAASSPGSFRRALQYARLVVQGEDVQGGGDAWARDRYMAENAAWLLSGLPAGSKIVLWAHNGHVNRSGSAMGTYLTQTYAGDLVIFGFDFYAGSFNAVNMTAEGYGGLIRHTIGGAPEGSYEQYFHAAGRPRMIVPLRGTVPAWLAGPRTLRSIGAVYSADYDNRFYFTASLPSLYDAVIFFDQTTASALLPFRYQ